MESTSRGAGPEISLVICTLDEHEAIAGVLAEAGAALDGFAYELIVVDDSRDERTADVVRRAGRHDPRIRLVRREGVRGLASACIAGWDFARGEFLGVMDGDGQHEAGLAARLIQDLRAGGADIAVASRFRPDTETGLGAWRRMLSRAGVGLSRLAIGAGTSDPMSGFFFQTRRWFEEARPSLSGLGFKILVDVLASGKRQPRVVELSTRLRARQGGASKLDLRIAVELLAQLVEKRTGGFVPGRFVMFAGVGASGVGVHLAALAVLAGTLPFWLAQGLAILLAMVSNFHLNNLITFHDLRLAGLARLRGLAGFVLACASGALVSELVAIALVQSDAPALAAGAGGALVSSVWNYWSSSRAAWGLESPDRDAAAGTPARSIGLAVREAAR